MLAQRNFQNLIFAAFQDYSEFVYIYIYIYIKNSISMMSKYGHIFKSV
jgi:hypothetical protein